MFYMKKLKPLSENKINASFPYLFGSADEQV